MVCIWSKRFSSMAEGWQRNCMTTQHRRTAAYAPQHTHWPCARLTITRQRSLQRMPQSTRRFSMSCAPQCFVPISNSSCKVQNAVLQFCDLVLSCSFVFEGLCKPQPCSVDGQQPPSKCSTSSIAWAAAHFAHCFCMLPSTWQRLQLCMVSSCGLCTCIRLLCVVKHGCMHQTSVHRTCTASAERHRVPTWSRCFATASLSSLAFTSRSRSSVRSLTCELGKLPLPLAPAHGTSNPLSP